MKDRKVQFIRAVRLLAPRDTLVLQFAERVRAELLPASPGAAALEFVAAMQRPRTVSSCPDRLPRWPARRQRNSRRSRWTGASRSRSRACGRRTARDHFAE